MKSDIKALEADGIKLINFEDPFDLRQSIGPKNRDPNETELMLLQELEIVKNERDELKQQKEQMAREHLNQTLNSNLDLKEENHILKEQDIIRNELLTRLEKEQERVTSEVSSC